MSEFERLKIELHNSLNHLRDMVSNAETVAKIHAIQQAIAKLEEF